jgi:RimJ/RimL family protein N-acetyltransferase
VIKILDVANKYQDEIELLMMNTWYDDKYKYFYASNYREKLNLKENNWDSHDFVSINKDGEIIGLISYGIDRPSNFVDSLCIINFTDDKITFGRDIGIVLVNIFEKFNYRKIEFSVIAGNPIEKSYDKLIHKYGGRIVGIYKDHVKLMDNKYYDEKMYEIFREDYLTNKNIK